MLKLYKEIKLMNNNVLILCTGNSCRSIITEALINSQLDNINAYSSGVKPSGHVNPNAKKVMEKSTVLLKKLMMKLKKYYCLR